MSKLDKDIHQKELAIRFCLVNSMVPFLEVNVQNFRELSDTSTLITDIDVLGVRIDSTGRPRRVIFDCKTLGKTSPINRAFWAAGLMKFVSCNEAFIVLRKKASEAHRLSAKQIGVHLFDERQFRNYAETCSVNFTLDYCYSSDIKSWTNLFLSASGNSNLEQFLNFVNSELPTEKDFVRGVRKFLAALNKIKGELDPDKAKHRAIFFYALSIFMYLMSQVVHDLRNIVDYEIEAHAFEKLLKYYIWGGRDSFILRNKMTELFSISNETSSGTEPELKNWPEFMELTRKLLDSPDDIQACIWPLREISFMNISERSKEKDDFNSLNIRNNNRTRQFSVSTARYLVDAVKLPKEFRLSLEKSFDSLREI